MKNSKLVQIIELLNKKQLRDLDNYLPSADLSAEARALYQIIRANAPDFSEQSLERERVFKLLFPNTPFNYQILRYKMTDLTKAIEDYLSYTEFLEQKKQGNIFLVKAYERLGLQSCMNDTLRDILRHIDKQNIRDSSYYLLRYQLLDSTLSLDKNWDETDSDTDNVLKNLDNYYFYQKLKLSCKMYNDRNFVVAAHSKPAFLDEIDQLVSISAADLPAALHIYKKILNLIINEQDDDFKQLLTYIEVNEHFFERQELYSIYIYLQNYCTKKYNSGLLEYAGKLFDLYKVMLEKGLLYEELPNGKKELAEAHYLNIVRLSARVKDFAFAETFINEHKNYINAEKRQNTFLYNLSYLYFEQKKFDKVLETLRHVDFLTATYALDARTLMLKYAYETDEETLLTNQLSSFRVFVSGQKNKVPESTRLIFVSFCKHLTTLAGIRYNPNRRTRAEIERLRAKMEEDPHSGHKNSWLYEKLEQMSKKISR